MWEFLEKNWFLIFLFGGMVFVPIMGCLAAFSDGIFGTKIIEKFKDMGGFQ